MAIMKALSVSRQSDRKILRVLEAESERERRPFSHTVFRYLEQVPELQEKLEREEALEEMKV